MTKKIAVLFGGISSEREISIQSGRAIFKSLVESGFNAHLVDTRDFPIMQLKKQGFNTAYIALHGRGGEDGSIQGILEYLNIPYTGSGIMASAISMDKLRSKLLWKSHSLPIGPYIHFKRNIFNRQSYELIIEKTSKLGLPVFVKPNNQGSSIGITRVDTINKLEIACKNAFFYDDTILIEKILEGKEYTISILGQKILPAIYITTKNKFYDYHAKYISHYTEYTCPSGLEWKKEIELKKIAKQAWNILDCKGCGRIDVILDNKKKFWLLEINTIPGMSPRSLVPIAAREAGIDFNELVLNILNMTHLDTIL